MIGAYILIFFCLLFFLWPYFCVCVIYTFVYLCIYMCAYGSVHIYAPAFGGQRLCFLSILYFETALSLTLKFTNIARQADQLALGILWYLHL